MLTVRALGSLDDDERVIPGCRPFFHYSGVERESMETQKIMRCRFKPGLMFLNSQHCQL